MDLKKRLAQLDRITRTGHGAVPRTTPAHSEDDLKSHLVTLGLTRTDGPGGPVWVREYQDPPAAPARAFPDLQHFFSRVGCTGASPPSILFLDTETTGLAGGTGTIPFLVGVSWWHDNQVVTRQWFLPGPGHEAAMLCSLADLAERFEVVVTFNGASFDLPLLRTRARLNRLDDPLADLESWDLLVPARRLWGRELDNCRQQTLETMVCRIARGEGDIDGAKIPQAWFDFLGGGGPGLLPAVLRHNHRDMLGMTCIFLRVLELAEARPDDLPSGQTVSWRLAWSLGRICEAKKDQVGARRWMEAAVTDGIKVGEVPLATERFLADTVRIFKRDGDWHRVEEIITGGLAAGIDQPWLHREAAILYEHRLVHWASALEHAVKSGEDHRVNRLQRLLAQARTHEVVTSEGDER